MNSMLLLNKKLRNSNYYYGRTARNREAVFDCQFASEAREYNERKSNVALQEKCKNLEHLVECNKQYSRRTCLQITNIRNEKDEM